MAARKVFLELAVFDTGVRKSSMGRIYIDLNEEIGANAQIFRELCVRRSNLANFLGKVFAFYQRDRLIITEDEHFDVMGTGDIQSRK